MAEAIAPTAATVSVESREFVTAAEVAQVLGLKKSRVYELARLGQLPAIRQGARWRFSRKGLDAMHVRALHGAEIATVADEIEEGDLVQRIAQAVQQAAKRGVLDGFAEMFGSLNTRRSAA